MAFVATARASGFPSACADFRYSLYIIKASLGSPKKR
jgi:hypothetical protein